MDEPIAQQQLSLVLRDPATGNVDRRFTHERAHVEKCLTLKNALLYNAHFCRQFYDTHDNIELKIAELSSDQWRLIRSLLALVGNKTAHAAGELYEKIAAVTNDELAHLIRAADFLDVQEVFDVACSNLIDRLQIEDFLRDPTYLGRQLRQYAPREQRGLFNNSLYKRYIGNWIRYSPLSTLGKHAGPVSAIALRSDSITFVTSSGKGYVREWNVRTGVLRWKSWSSPKKLFSINADGTQVACLTATGRMSVCNIQTKDTIFMQDIGEQFSIMVWSADSSFIMVAGKNCLRKYDAQSGALLLDYHFDPIISSNMPIITALQCNNNNKIAIGFFDGLTLVCDSAMEGRPKVLYEFDEGMICCVAWSPDNKKIIIGSADTIARIWDTATWQCFLLLRGHYREITALTWKSDGTCVVTGSNDHTCRIWDATTGDCLITLYGDAVRSLLWTPDGVRLIAGFANGNLQLWNTSTNTNTERQLNNLGLAQGLFLTGVYRCYERRKYEPLQVCTLCQPHLVAIYNSLRPEIIKVIKPYIKFKNCARH